MHRHFVFIFITLLLTTILSHLLMQTYPVQKNGNTVQTQHTFFPQQKKQKPPTAANEPAKRLKMIHGASESQQTTVNYAQRRFRLLISDFY